MLKDVAIRRAAAWAVAGLLYMLWPFDAVPDWAIVVGWVDDALVVAFAAYMAYRAYQSRVPDREPPRGPEHAKPVKPLPPDPEDKTS
ncbi:MAG: hypothetical protein FD126_2957 [Elusimicrobia bacterium]|nr:MAG: hypothetical protein FD126_2957 [Elusimicrobiota bacterium]